MTVYGDVVIAVNTAINYLLLLLGAKLCGRPVARLRALGGAALGGIYALLVLLPLPAFVGAWWMKGIFFLLMAALAYGVKRSAIRPAAVCLLCSAALAGCMILLTQLLDWDFVTLRGTVYYPITGRVLILIAGIFYLAAALLAAGALKSAGKLYPLRLSADGRTLCVTSLYDTGNSLTDPISGKPVIVLDWRRGTELLDAPAAEELLKDPVEAMSVLSRLYPEKRLRLVPYDAVGVTGGMLLAFSCDAQVGKRKHRAVTVALSPTAVSDGSYEALIGGSIL